MKRGGEPSMKKVGSFLNKNAKYVLTIPTILFILVCVTYPMFYTLRLAFFDWKMSAKISPEFVGFANFIDFFGDPRFRNALWRTIWYTFVAVSIETALGVTFALMLNKIKRASNVIRTIFLMPMVATPVAVGILWKLIYDPTIGLANNALSFFGLPTSTWLGSASTVMMSLIIIDIWQWTPNIMLIVLAGLSGMDDSVVESSRIDGANELQMIWHVTLPILTPTILMAVLLRMIDALKTFDIIYTTTTGGPGYASENLNILTYTYAFNYLQMGNACTLLVIFFVVVCGFALLFSLIRRRVERRFV